MRTLHATDLLEIWDRGRDRHPVDRALVVLAFAFPELGWDELGALPIGERNRLLLWMRATTFGPRLELVTSCPACSEQLEFDFTFPLERYAPSPPREVETTLAAGERLRLRLPDSRDLAAIAGLADPAVAKRRLLERCICAPAREGEAVGHDHERVVPAFSAAVEEHDPLAVISFPVGCVACTQPWRATLDPIDYIWRELGHRVVAIVRDVDVLARAYGWTESEILRLSPGRRRLYIDRVGARAC